MRDRRDRMVVGLSTIYAICAITTKVLSYMSFNQHKTLLVNNARVKVKPINRIFNQDPLTNIAATGISFF
jgi:hypothetical protein